jgi:hypothetical protein
VVLGDLDVSENAEPNKGPFLKRFKEFPKYNAKGGDGP